MAKSLTQNKSTSSPVNLKDLNAEEEGGSEELSGEDVEGRSIEFINSKFETSSTNSISRTEDLESHTDSDALQQVRDHSKKENLHVSVWRITLIVILLSVGVAVTLLTYKFLRDDEVTYFETAFEQFSRTVADAAIQQQLNMRNGYRNFANTLTAHAQGNNSTWPFVTIPLFESYADHFIIQSGIELFSVFPLVKADKKEEWLQYANDRYEGMIKEAHMLHTGSLERLDPVGYHPYMATPDLENGGLKPDIERDFYYASWHYSPPPFTYGFINWNVYSVPDYGNAIDAIRILKNETVVTRVRKYVGVGIAFTLEEHEAMHSTLPESNSDHPHSFLYHPIHEKANDYNSNIVGILGGGFAWDASLLNLLPQGVVGLRIVIKNDCDQEFTYEVNGPEAIYMGEGDLHDTRYDEYERVVNLALHTHPDFTTTPGHCQFTMHIYPGIEFEESYRSYAPLIYAVVVASTFLLVAVVFYIYNFFVNRRNEKLVHNAARSNAVISALFPKNIRERILEDELERSERMKHGNRTFNLPIIRGHAAPTDDLPTMMKRPPLADYFPETTILFADISGFTAWSSVREPYQVFTLLETLYGAFDKIAKLSRVFKVETVGDCYVAATGIPDFHKDHSVHMVKFARKIFSEMTIITKDLEITLGPDTGDLSLRIGIHSGPVTAGVLRGEKARFQLFGDTMNTASRIESTGEEGRIHVSDETAEHLKNCGKDYWLVKREEPVKIKGKGDIQTYWVCVQGDSITGDVGTNAQKGGKSGIHVDHSMLVHKPLVEDENELAAKEARLVDWNVQMLMDFLRQIIARRIAAKGLNNVRNNHNHDPHHVLHNNGHHVAPIMDDGFQPLNEVHEIIRLPEFDSRVAKLQKNHHYVEIPPPVEQQLRTYVSCIAAMYRRNNFHSFEHASHVTMSVIKLMSRIVAPTDLDDGMNFENRHDTSLRAQLHDHTYGITSDPLTQFACAFAALIHDVDHQGVPNAQLVKEKVEIAVRYKQRSVAEQNSMVLAWNLLMEDRFEGLRNCLCETPQELRRFRSLAINAVMATDITDKELKNLRNARWDKAFKDDSSCDHNYDEDLPDQNVRDSVHRKATIVIEHLLQASDVAHTMQHWHVYRKWNERFFRECYAAYKAGRAENDPSENWYNGEIGFFDFYIIPLAKKLDTCGVFGKASDEYLNYALQNREEWKIRGQEVLAEMVEAVKKEYEETNDHQTCASTSSENEGE